MRCSPSTPARRCSAASTRAPPLQPPACTSKTALANACPHSWPNHNKELVHPASLSGVQWGHPQQSGTRQMLPESRKGASCKHPSRPCQKHQDRMLLAKGPFGLGEPGGGSPHRRCHSGPIQPASCHPQAPQRNAPSVAAHPLACSHATHLPAHSALSSGETSQTRLHERNVWYVLRLAWGVSPQECQVAGVHSGSDGGAEIFSHRDLAVLTS